MRRLKALLFSSSMRNPRPRFNVIELALFGVLIAVLAFIGGLYRTRYVLAPYLSNGPQELASLEKRYGPSRNSEHGEEWIVRDYFHDQRGGVFVDVGANDYRRFSNTFFLETNLGWSGLAIEPQTKFAEGYAQHRPRTVFIPLFVSDSSNGQAVLHVPANNDLIASADPAFVQALGGEKIVSQQMTTTTLDAVLERQKIDHLDFLSIDVELHEPEVLRGLSVERFQPRLVCVEAHPEVRQRILDYFAAHGYAVLGKYLRADTQNLWFTPSKRS